jgi:amino acid adenylation domain-containing protein
VFAGLQTAPLGFDHGIARFELSVEIAETPDGLSCSFEHDTAVLDRATIARLMSGFETLLQQIVADPDQCIETFSLEAEAEPRQIPQDGNVARPHIPEQCPIHSLFEIQAVRKPTATAVLYDGNGLSYAALNRRANQLAHFLRDLGVGPETLVGICAERSLEMAVGILGTLKAGGAYVPLDPHYPAERLAFMLQDSAVRVILTQQRLLSVLPPHEAEMIALDMDWQSIARQSEENPQCVNLAGHPAYVIYTSGSTGQPKGVFVTHGGVVNHSLAVAELFNLRPQDRVSQCNSLNFDISVEEFFSSWISGAAVVLCPAEKFLPDEEFARWITSEEITVLNLPTPFWHEWVAALQSRQKAVSEFLRLVVVGGDKARSDVLVRWRSIAAPEARWLNTYGPTEATVTTTAYAETLGATAEAMQIAIPIGRPIAGAQVYVVDGNLNPVPIGVPGELYIGGAGLARGYLNRPELTSERFIPNPFAGEPGMRLYRTGDLCRYLADGNIEFLGRTDHQVKIRGFRIELEEIECALAEHPAVREAAVVAREDEAGAAKRLIAYVIAEQSPAATIQELRSFLKDKLPEYMVPSAFVFLESLPLTPSGKLDRKALPAPDGRRLEQDESLSVPATPIQEMLAGVWAQVLKVEEVGFHENFFDLGGHSLLATQIMSGVRKLFQVELPLRSLFESPTVAGLADRIEEALCEERGMPAPAIVARSRNHDLPLSFAQQRLWFLDRLEPNRAVYNLPAVLRIRGPLNVIALEQSLNEIVQRHEALRTIFPMIEGKPVQIITPPGAHSLPVIDLRERAESEREGEARRLAKEETRRPFDLTRGPVFRTTLIRVGEDDHILILAMHHIVSDGWSMGVLHRELSALYQTFSHFEPSPLPELPVQYADYAVWQREWLQGNVLEKQISYWRNQLHGVAKLQLPTDRPRPTMQSYRGARQSLHLSREVTDRLKALSRAEGATLFMTLLAAFQTLLHLYTGQNDIVVGTPIAGRNRQESEGLIGFFVNTLVLRTDVSGNLNFNELLGRVRKTALEAYEHQDLPFEKLVEALQPERNLSHSPLFQVMFVLQNAPASALKCEGLTITRVGLGSETAKFDLGLSAREESAGLRISLQYCIDLFDESTITGMLAHFKTLLESIASDPEQILSDFECLTEQEQRRLLDERIEREAPAQVQFDDLELLTNLTPLQFQFWIGQKLNPAMPLYNIEALFTIAGAIIPERFQSAFQTLIDQTDALRTIIEENGEVPHARILADLPYSMEFVDYSSRADASAALQEWVEGHSGRLFDLGKRAFDTALLKLADYRYVWYLNIHHIIADGWSFAVIFQRMRRLYQCSLEPLFGEIETPPAFHEYVEDERSYLRSRQYRRDQAYWQKKLAQAAEPLKFYGQAPAAGAVAVRRVTFALGDERVRKIKIIALRPGFTGRTLSVSLFNIFAAVFAAYLYRISGNECISIGTPFLNRSRAFRQTVGLFMQVAPLRLLVSAGDTFASLVQKMQAESLAAQKHRRFTLRNFQHRLYDAIFNYHNTSFSDFNGAPVQETWLHSGNDTTSLSLHLRNPEDSNLSLQFDFHPDVFDEEQQERAIGHFRRLVDAFLADPNQRITEVDLLSEEEKHRFLVEFNASEITSSESACVHQLFERQAVQAPEAVALVAHTPDLKAARRQQLTYGELNASANRLAHYLRNQCVAPGVLVGVCFERSFEAVIAILAVLKAGGAYLPLDPDYPTERLSFMLEDAQPLILLTNKRWAAILPAHRAQMICLDTDGAVLARESVENPMLQQTSDDPAYVIYTSGSTGRSKGVLVAQRSLLHAYLAWETSYQLRSAHAHLQMANLSFDVFSGDLTRALCSGGKLVFCPTEIMLEPALLYRLMRQEAIDWAEFVPPVLRQLIKYVSETHQRLDFMRGLVCGSDTWHVDDYRRCLQFCGPMTRLINSYGVTEATIDSCFFEGVIPNRIQCASVPIGRRFGQTQLYVLDASMRPTPIGVSGELYIGGQGLARGYLNRPDLTAEKFIPNPFSSEPGSHLYQTGDLVRYLADGNIEFLGRVDRQVKVRGFRIELEEIESVLARHPALGDVVVLAREDDSGDFTTHGSGKRLVAYVIGGKKPAPSVHELRSFLKEKLPAYMVPSAFVFLDVFPLTANGKVDRNALPAYDAMRHEQQTGLIAPRDELELQLAKLWEKVLKVRPIGVLDNFFDLGGHSLLAVQLFAQIEKFVGNHLPLAALFQAPTIEQLARLIRQQDWSAPWKSLVAIQPGGTRPPLFCVHAHDGGVLFWRDLARHLGPDQPFYALQPQGLNGKQPLHSDIEEMAAHYIEEIRTLQPEGPYFIGGHCLGGLIAFEMAQQLHVLGQTVGLLALFDSYAPHRDKSVRSSPLRRYRNRAMRFFERTVTLHIGNLAVLAPKERLPYVKGKINKALYKLYMALGRRWVPAARNRRMIVKTGSRASSNYQPKVYPGKITLFRATDLGAGIGRDPQMGWGRLAGGGLETRLIPGYHAHIVLEPRVRLLVKELTASLRRAQEEFNNGHPTPSAAHDETAGDAERSRS